MKGILICLLLSGIYVSLASAQSITITGKVSDERNSPIALASVAIKGTKNVAQTDVDGNYRIQLPQNLTDATLVFSFIGYNRKEIKLMPNRTVYNVSLQISTQGLDEVIVVGYGASKKTDLTGSVGSVKMGDLQKAPVASFDQALAGRVAGVQVSAGDGQPGADMNIVIRGNSSITQDNSPLYVVDGFPIETSLNSLINPSEIESIDVLKDASATAIYGARGANGVIIVTTISPFFYRTTAGVTTKVNYTAAQIYDRNIGKWRREYELLVPKHRVYNSTNFPVIRYSDVLLMKAEAENKVNGPTSAAYTAINQVKRRGFGKPVNIADAAADVPAGLTPDQFLVEIQNERARELSFEGLRKHDLIRWGLYLSKMSSLITEVDNGPATTWKARATTAARNTTERNLLLPIPTLEMNSNPNIKENNFGW